MPKQAPKHTWRYGCVRRTYKTMLPDGKFQETHYELVEVYDEGKSYTAEAVSLSADSKDGLIATLARALNDLIKYPQITDQKTYVHMIGNPNGKNRKNKS